MIAQRQARVVSDREQKRIKSAVYKATEQDTEEIFRLRAQIRDLEARLSDARKSRDKWKLAAYEGGCWKKARATT